MTWGTRRLGRGPRVVANIAGLPSHREMMCIMRLEEFKKKSWGEAMEAARDWRVAAAEPVGDRGAWWAGGPGWSKMQVLPWWTQFCLDLKRKCTRTWWCLRDCFIRLAGEGRTCSRVGGVWRRWRGDAMLLQCRQDRRKHGGTHRG